MISPDPNPGQLARRAIADGRVAWLVVSGKMAAGKDTIAPQLAGLLPGRVVFPRYGNLMRAELDPILDLVRRAPAGDDDGLAATIGAAHGLDTGHASALVARIRPEMDASGGTLTAHSRTHAVRWALQQLGDAWRCSDDPGYWSRRAVNEAVGHLAAGDSVITTGGRFVTDVTLPAEVGAVLLRLDVTRATQLTRLGSRDGLTVGDEVLAAMAHPGETELDDWSGFHVRVSNDGDAQETLAALAASLPAALEEGRRAAEAALAATR